MWKLSYCVVLRTHCEPAKRIEAYTRHDPLSDHKDDRQIIRLIAPRMAAALRVSIKTRSRWNKWFWATKFRQQLVPRAIHEAL